jgi:hypothetical protein
MRLPRAQLAGWLVVAVACTSCASLRAARDEILAGADSPALALCKSRLPNISAAEFDTAAAVRSWGPQPTTRSARQFAEYPDEQQIALCLLPSGADGGEVYGFAAGTDDAPVHLWSQSGISDMRTRFYPPV